MKEWKIRQDLYHRLETTHRDDLNQVDIRIETDIVNNAIRYFTETNVGWIYPAKSYMVAICYSKWLSEIFGGEPIEYLNDEDLLYNNDPYFVPYHKDKENYDKILKEINGWNFENIGFVPDVKQYFDDEFLIKDS